MTARSARAMSTRGTSWGDFVMAQLSIPVFVQGEKGGGGVGDLGGIQDAIVIFIEGGDDG